MCCVNNIIQTVIGNYASFIVEVWISFYFLEANLVSDFFLGHFADEVRNLWPKVTVDILAFNEIIAR